ncbi:peptidoglycan recognition family protein [Sporomusa paucivorans]|uniref:peptidoglycan recognition protein family protein n=1 Tax=Sporomusa paucivorans TaxID=2376 RepID=UPI0035713A79
MLNIKETNLKFGAMNRQHERITRVVIHHVGDPPRDVSAEEIHRWHKENDWAGIGYHYVVRTDGTIERGRPEEYVGAHAQGFNTGSIGVNFAGNMDKMEPTPAQIESGAILLADICTRHGITPTPSTVVGHRDLMATSCPGKNLYDILQTLRGKAIWYQQNGY